MNRRQLLATIGAGSISAFIAGCTGRELDDEFTVTITQGEFLNALDPHGHVNTPDTIILGQAYEYLLDRTVDGEIIGRLATDWERVEPNRLRLEIREGVTFHNGDDLTPEDVSYSINRIIDEDVGITSPQASSLSPVTGAEVVDGEHAVDVVSDGFNDLVESQLTSYGAVVNKTWVEDRSEGEVNQEINGTGPLMLEEYEEDVDLTYVPYDDYWDEAPEFTELTFNSASESSTRVNELITGSTTLIANVPPHDIDRIESEDDLGVDSIESTRAVFAGMRYDVEPFSSEEFRQAMNYAIDLDSIVNDLVDGYATPMSQPTVNNAFGHNPDIDPYPYDPELAEELVDESGFDGAEITLETPVGRYLQDNEIAQAAANYIDELPNVSCSVEERDFNNLVSEVANGDITTSPPFYLLGWGNSLFDASHGINPVLTTDGVSASYKNDEIDDLMSQARAEEDDDVREELYHEVNQLLHDRAPWLYLIQEHSIYGSAASIEWQPRADEFIDAHEITEQ